MGFVEIKVTKNTSKTFRTIPARFQQGALASGLNEILHLLQLRVQRYTQKFKKAATNSIRYVMSKPTEGKLFSDAPHINSLVHGRRTGSMPVSALQTWARAKGMDDPERAGWRMWMHRNVVGNSASGYNIRSASTPPGPRGWGNQSSPQVPSEAWTQAAGEMRRTSLSVMKKWINAFKWLSS